MSITYEPVWDNNVAIKFIGKLVKVTDVSSWLDKDANWGYRHFKGSITTGSWPENWDSLDEVDKSKIKEMVETRKFTYRGYWDDGDANNKTRYITIEKYAYDSETQTAQYLIFVKNQRKVAFITDNIPEDIYDDLCRVWPWNFYRSDLIHVNSLSSIELFGKKYIYPDNNTHWKIEIIMKRHAQDEDYSLHFNIQQCAWGLGYDRYLRLNSMDALNRYKDELKKIANSENEVYFLTTRDPLYSSMSQWANRRGGTLNQLISTLGFSRVYKRENPFQDILLHFNRPDTEDDIDERLKRLERMQGTLNKTPKGNSRLQRCKELVDELKKLYGNRCQLCGEENGEIPFIEKENGDYYSEMHHIIPLSEVDNLSEEWQFIDTYQNVMICCPHHHRYLHNHHGGFKTPIFENNEIFLESRKGTRVRIVMNLHLKPH